MKQYQIDAKIKGLLKEKNISLRELCRKIEFSSQGYYNSIKNDSLRIDTLQKIAEVLEVDIRVFFGGGANESLKSDYESLETVLRFEREKANLFRFMVSELIQFVFSNTYYKELINNFVTPTDFAALQMKINRRIEKYKPVQHGYYIPLNNETIITIINGTLFEYPAITEAFEKKKVKNSILLAQYEVWKKTPPVIPEFNKED